MSLLSVKDLSASYGLSRALFGVDLEVGEGEAVALMGRNGMGKSTTVKCICRLLPSSSGTLTFDRHDLSVRPSHQVARLGIGLVPEGRRCFARLSVRENLIAAARPGPWSLTTVHELFPRLGERAAQSAASLSGGEQQMLAIARALMTNPRLLILDEATEGLAPTVRREIWSTIRRLKVEAGMAMLVIDKSVAELRGVCDRAVVIERGRTVWAGPSTDLTADLTARYVGI